MIAWLKFIAMVLGFMCMLAFAYVIFHIIVLSYQDAKAKRRVQRGVDRY